MIENGHDIYRRVDGFGDGEGAQFILEFFHEATVENAVVQKSRVGLGIRLKLLPLIRMERRVYR